ncbi:unnamed protein product [Effrenium voratum]|uniref:Uncharacterized protein n=1 Tax=Effrenium voratum TaxID=2562239 RepID=A0AA36J6S5_9DINO|nr:unnamed protein product [Effrenium voratum]CAJ1399526.1 unnamed protein product [Effrenium voratum]CAJ1419371.1 unnamed protein product [Effrenium voratum]
MGKKKDKEAKAAEPDKTGAAPCAVPEDAYRSAAVVFFTRSEEGKVAKVLVALEERKVSASFVGDGTGKVNQLLVVFPMGRKEKKDKNDAVETAKREYIEETLDYGSLARYLDFADFDGGGDIAATRIPPGGKVPMTWSGAENLALYFAPAAMTLLFCEVPPCEVDEPGQEPAAKKRRQQDTAAELEAKPKPSPSYRVGKVGHLQPFWIEATELRKVALSKEKAPKLSLQQQDCCFFPTNASVLRMPEARKWLDISS